MTKKNRKRAQNKCAVALLMIINILRLAAALHDWWPSN